MDYPPCSDCSGRCCKWIIVPWDEAQAAISELRGGRLINIDRKPRYWAFKIECKKLTQGGKCSIYHKRPIFCRENPAPGSFICDLTRALEKTEGPINLE